MTWTRRDFLNSVMIWGLSPAVMAKQLSAESVKREVWFSAQGTSSQGFGYAALTDETRLMTGNSTFRGHGSAIHPLKPASVILFARRPGREALEINLKNGQVEKRFEAEPNRHFYGHGCFSGDGKWLFTTEADVKHNVGKIGIRDAVTYQKVGEYESYGIGPHEMKLMPDGQTLVIANGGMLTRPETGRKVLNLATMNSHLTYVNALTGQKVDAFHVPEPKASIRHLDVAKDGTVAIAMQVQREAMTSSKLVPLGAIQKPGQSLRYLSEPVGVLTAMNDYMGSVAINNRSRIAGFTSPRGDVAAFWYLDEERFAGYYRLNDVCGLTVSEDESHFILSNSFGSVRQLNAFTLEENRAKRQKFAGIAWDNHLISAAI